MRGVKLFAALGAAVLVQVLGVRFLASFPLLVDPFLLVAIAVGLGSTVVGSMVGGTLAGLARDALSGGLYGLHGFADTLVAWSVARLRQRFVIRRSLQVGLLYVLAAGGQQVLVAALQLVMVPGSELPGPATTVAKMILTGLLGIALFVLGHRARDLEQKWRDQRHRRLRIEK